MSEEPAASDGPALNERLLLSMKRAHLTQTELAERLHTNPRVLRRYLSGQRPPPPEILEAWERECGLGSGELRQTDHQVAAVPPSPPSEAQRGRSVRVGLIVVLVAALIGAAVVWFATTRNQGSARADRPDAVPCPPRPANATFAGRTFKDGVVVRDGAGQDFPLRSRVEGDCDLPFSGYCVGQAIADVFGGTLDSRWFIIRARGPLDGGLVASGVIKGDTPPGSQPVPCPGSRAIPTSIDLLPAVGPDGAPTGLRAVATGADVVGFAALLPISGSAGPPKWQQVGFEQGGPNGFTLQLIGTLPPGAGDVPVAAVICLAAGAPTATQALTLVRSTDQGPPMILAGAPVPDPGADGRQAACRFPSNAPPASPPTTVR